MLIVLPSTFFFVFFIYVWEIFIQIIALERLDLGLYHTPLPAFFKCLSISDFSKNFHGRLVYPLHNSSPLFYFNEIFEVPGEIFCNIEIKLNVLCVNDTIVHDLIKQPLVHVYHVASNLFVLVGSMIEFPSFVVFEVYNPLLVYI